MCAPTLATACDPASSSNPGHMLGQGSQEHFTDVTLVADDIDRFFLRSPPQAKYDLLGPSWLQLSRPVGSHQDFTDVALVSVDNSS